MPFPTPFHDSQPAETPAAIVRHMAREDMMWDRPVFKAPPLKVVPPLADLAELARAVRKPEALGS
ncbi:MAG: hypothetical protein ABIZ04_09015 [Opitutus sp.]